MQWGRSWRPRHPECEEPHQLGSQRALYISHKESDAVETFSGADERIDYDRNPVLDTCLVSVHLHPKSTQCRPEHVALHGLGALYATSSTIFPLHGALLAGSVLPAKTLPTGACSHSSGTPICVPLAF